MSSFIGRRNAWRALQDSEYGLLFAFAAVAATVLVVCVVMASRQDAAYERTCADLGGRVDTSTSTASGFVTDPNTGRPGYVTTTSTTTLCLSPDGRILDVQ